MLKQKKRFIIFLIFIFIALNFTLSVQAAATNITSCIQSYNITTSGEYNLIDNINTSHTQCIDIQTGNVTIDCQGFNISAGGTYAIHFSGTEKNNVTIKNCLLESNQSQSCSHGIYAEFSTPFPTGINIINNTINGMAGRGIYLSGVDSSIIANNTITNNGLVAGYGIDLNDYCDNNLIIDNYLSFNGASNLDGIHVYASTGTSNGNNITENTVVESGRHGIYLEGDDVDNTRVTNNTVNHNGNSGVYIKGDYNLLENITSINNSNYGLALDGSSYNNITNLTTECDNFGIYLSSSPFNTLTKIISNNNTFNGIWLSSSSTNVFRNITMDANPNSQLLIEVSMNNEFNYITITNSTQDAIEIGSTAHNNNLTNLTIVNTNKGFYDFHISSEQVNGTWIVNTKIANYSFSGSGGTLNIKDPNFGIIQFSEIVNGSGANLSEDIKITNNSIMVNITTNSGFNSAANITMFGINTAFTNPGIWRDDVPCYECYNSTSLSANTVEFNLSSWSTYTLGEGWNILSCMALTKGSRPYNLTLDIVPDGTNSCINISVANVNFDCAGYSIRNISFGNAGIYSNGSNTTIKNCNITLNFTCNVSAGIWLSGGVDNVIQNNTLISNYYGIYTMSNANHAIILDNIIQNSNSSGIYANSLNNNVTNNYFYNNTIGIHLGSDTLGNTITNNNISNSSSLGINSSLARNTIWYISKRNILTNNNANINGSLVFGTNGILELINSYLTINETFINNTGNLTSLEYKLSSIIGSNATDLDFSSEDSNITLFLVGAVNSSVIVSEENLTTAPNVTTATNKLKGVDIVVDPSTLANLTWALIKISYNSSELSSASVTESTLKIYYYNISAGDWELEADQGVNSSDNFIWANVTHFSLFGVFGYLSSDSGSSISSGSSWKKATESSITLNEQGIIKTLTKNSKLSFIYETEEHSVILKSISLTGKTVIEISSLPKEYTLEVGDVVQEDLDGDGNYDLEIELLSLKWISSAEFRFRLLNTKKDNTIIEKINQTEDELVEPKQKVIAEKESLDYKKFIIIGTFVIIVAYLIGKRKL